MICTFTTTPETTCTDIADVILDGKALCANHLHELFPAKVEAGLADQIVGLVFVD